MAMQRIRDLSVDRGAVKALVAAFGPREAARRAGLPYGTVTAWCCRYKWRQARLPAGPEVAISGKDAGDAMREALEDMRQESTVNLAQFTLNASKKAADHSNPLKIARSVRDVASVHSTVWPKEERSGLIEGEILIGMAEVRDDVRQTLPDKGQTSH